MYRKLKFTLLFVFFVLFGQAQSHVVDSSFDVMLKGLLKHNVPEVDVENLSQDTAQIIYLDAREKIEYEVSHIKNAIWVGYDTFSANRIKNIPRNTKIVVYCSVGYRSEIITKKILEKGYMNVSNLYGGIFEWVNQGNAVYAQEKLTTKVHTYDKLWGGWLKKGMKVY